MKKWIYLVMIAIVTIMLLLLAGCFTHKPIKIGYVGGLTGRFSDIGISGQNGVMLAIEESNETGGIKGRRIELLAEDDHGDAALALKADQELVSKGVAVIIGHMTSAASVAAMPFINSPDAKNTLMISPTTRTSKLTGIEDNFFSVIPPMKAATDAQAEYVRTIGIKKMIILYDLANRDFSEDWAANFTATYQMLGGEIIAIRQFQSGTNFSYLQIIEEITKLRPDGILLIAGGVDGAMFCQQIQKVGLKAKVFSSSWAMTYDFLQNGGPAVEGVIFSNPVNPENNYPKYEAFSQKYQQRFGKKPDFAAAYGYEAANVAIEGLKFDSQHLKKNLLAKKDFTGLWGPFTLDSFGDAQRGNYILSVQDGSFKQVSDE